MVVLHAFTPSRPPLLFSARSEEGAAPRDSAEYLTEMPRVKFDSVLLEVKHH